MAQFSYQLVTGCIADIIPLYVRIQRNTRDADAARALVALFMNSLFQARDAHYQSVTIGVLQVSELISIIVLFVSALICVSTTESLATGLQWVIIDDWV